jgi:Protein of unknown function (DUF3300)
MRRQIQTVLARCVPIGLAILLAAPPLPRAQQPAGDVRPFKPEELEQIVAPLALYPDPLVAQIFMAATYPLEVIQAARFAKANPNLKDAALSEELKKQNWDDSVKALVSFPQVLEMMDSQLEWMQKLGDAVLAQQKETMDAIQRLRAKAQVAGNLKSTEQQKVIVERVEGQPRQQTIIRIEPANPEVIYVPTYNPTVVYGAWPYPAYPPYYYYPPYYPVGYFAATAAISFGLGMLAGGAIWGGCNWGGGDIDIDVNRQNNFSRNVNRGDRVNQLKTERGSGARGDRGSWQHSPEHRKGAQYRDSATQQKFNRGGDSARAASRESFRGRAEQGRQDLARGGAGQGAARSREGGVGSAGGAQRGGGVGQSGAGAARSREGAIGSGAGGQRGGAGGGRAFEGVGQGQSQRSYSQRGESSRGGSYSGGGSRGGGGGFSGGGGGRGGGGGGRGGGRR